MHQIITIVAQYFVVIPVATFALIWMRLNKNDRVSMLVLAFVSLVATVALAKLAASLHQDPRPFVRDGVTPYFGHSIDNGFPSDHTTYSALIAFVVLVYSRRLGIALAVVSLLIGTARVIAGVHHAQDIIGGFLIAAIGVSLSWLALQVATRLSASRKS